MALRCIIGRSGCGKSTALYRFMIEESLKNPRVQYLLITPDQFTLDTQKMVVGMHPNHGFMNIDILSFHRLAHKIFAELSEEPGVILEDLGKSMVLQKILGRRKKELPLFGSNRDKMGFVDELKSLFSEFYQYGVTQEILAKQVEKEKEGTLLHEKLSELLIIMKDFEEFMGKDYIAAEQLLTVLGRRAAESEILKNSVVILDGFTGFTPVQNDLLAKILPVCRDMYVSVTLDEREKGFKKILDYELFAVSKETISVLKKIANEQNVPVKEDWVVINEKNGRFEAGGELDFLERNLFRMGAGAYGKEPEQVRIARLADPEEEAIYTAKTISRLIREEGVRYREIGVICGDLSRYGMRLTRIFKEYEIPCFLDDTTGMRSHPFVECIRGIFALFTYDFSYESVCHYIKNGMTKMKKEDADALDSYLFATGLRGYGVFAAPFKRKPRKISEKILAQAEAARSILYEEIRELAVVFRKKKGQTTEYIDAIRVYMEKMGYEQRLEEEATGFEEAGEYVFMSAYSQVYGLFTELLDKISAILGEEELELLELGKIVDAGLEQMELGVIPPGPDQVVIGDVERTRLNQLKVLFFLGLNEGVVPKPEAGGGILSDGDREELAASELSLAPGARKTAGLEQFYLYLALTRPSKRLYLTLASVDQDGKSIRPSYLVGRLKLLYPKMKIQEGMESGREFYTMKSALSYVRQGLNAWFLGQADEEDEALLKWLFRTEEGKQWINTALQGRFYTNGEKSLSLAAAKAIYGLEMEASVTRLENYAGCAFAHFLKYGLMISTRQKYQIQSADLGQILHRCMELFIKEAKTRGYGLKFMEEEKRDALAVECLRKAVEDYDSSIFHSSARNEACIDRMERLVKRTVWAMVRQLQNSDFEPTELEWKFQSRKELEAVKLELAHGGSLQLQGIVDRIDCYEDEENLYLKITDYKSGMQTFDLADIYNGLSLQLVVYMNAAMEKAAKDQKKNPVPAGIFYFHIQDPFVERKEDSSAEEDLFGEFDLSGLVLAEQDIVEHMDSAPVKSLPVGYKKDGNFTSTSSVATREQFRALGDYVKKQLIAYGNGILDGNIAIEPYKQEKRTACDYCDYKGVCGFDPAFSGNRYRKIKKAAKKDIWDRVENGESGTEEKEGR